MAISPDKEKSLETAMTQVERQFGKGSIMKLGSRPVVDVPVISTSSLALDKALGIGGYPTVYVGYQRVRGTDYAAVKKLL